MIEKQDLEQLIHQAELKLSGSTVSAIKAELYDVLTEFFEFSSSWVEAIQVDSLAYQREFFVVPNEGQIIRLGTVVMNSLFPTNAAYEALEDASPPTNQDLGAWLPIAATMPHPGHVFIRWPVNTPQATRIVVIKNVTLPTGKERVPIAPSWVIPRWHNTILDGILGKMFGTPNMTYSSDASSVYHHKRFQESMARARVASLKGEYVRGASVDVPGKLEDPHSAWLSERECWQRSEVQLIWH